MEFDFSFLWTLTSIPFIEQNLLSPLYCSCLISLGSLGAEINKYISVSSQCVVECLSHCSLSDNVSGLLQPSWFTPCDNHCTRQKKRCPARPAPSSHPSRSQKYAEISHDGNLFVGRIINNVNCLVSNNLVLTF